MALADALRAGARRLRPSAEVTLADGRTLSLGSGDILSLRIREGADSPLTAGNVISAACELTLENAGDRWLPVVGRQGSCRFEGAFVRMFLEVMDGEDWVRCPLGTFIVSGTRFPEQQSVLTLTGSDSIATALSAAFTDEGPYPCTLEALWRRAVAQSGYSWDGNMAGGEAIVDQRPDWGDISLRGALGHIAQAAGCFVHLDRQGGLTLERCGRSTHDALLGPEAYMTLEQTFATFGPVTSLRVEPKPDASGEAEAVTVYARDYDGTGDGVSVRNNPLFVHGAAHLTQLAENMLTQLVGLALTQARFRWRGDPAVGVGSCVLLRDTHNLERLVMVTRQTITYDGGFSAECECEVPTRQDAGVARLFTGGGLNAAALVGAIGGAQLANGCISARHIQAGSVTAQSIAAHSITADHLQAGSVNAQAITAITAKVGELAAGHITADALYAAIADIAAASIQTASIDWASIQTLRAQIAQIADAQVGQLRAEVVSVAQAAIDDAVVNRLQATVADLVDAHIAGARITTAQISDLRAEIANVIALASQDGRFDFARVSRLVSGAMILEEGVAGTVMIRNLVATRANFVGAILGELVLRGEDGNYYEVAVQSDGAIRTRPVTVSDGEIAAGETSDGRAIVSAEANIAELNAGSLRAQSAVIGQIFAGALAAGRISASEAFLASASVPELYATAVRAIGDSLSFSARESIRMEVSRAVRDTVAGARNYLTGSLALDGAMHVASRRPAIGLLAAGLFCRARWRLCGTGPTDGCRLRFCGTFACGEGV